MGCRYATVRGVFAGRKRRTTTWQQTDDDEKADRFYSGAIFSHSTPARKFNSNR